VRTRSGTLVTPFEGVPTLEDIAWGLMRAPRFGGHTEEPWSVAEHSLGARQRARLLRLGPRMELHALVHDQHEAFSGDVPSTWKPDQLREWQHLLDERVYAAYGWPLMTGKERTLVAAIDQDMLLAEAKLVGPLGSYEQLSQERQAKAAQDALDAVSYVWLGRNRSEDSVYHAMLVELKRAARTYA